MKKSVKKELVEWVIFVSIIGVLYITGLHTEVIGTIQRVVLSSGIIQPDYDKNSTTTADYNYMLEDINGQNVSLNSFKNQTVFINYWATWCPPCIAEMPDINDLYLKKKDDVQFLMISVDEDKEKAIEFMKRKGFDFPIYFESSPRPEQYRSQSIPTTVVISPIGTIAAKNTGMAKYDTESFRTFLNELNSFRK